MLLVIFQLGNDRYALDAKGVVEIVPLLNFKRLPHGPKGVAGVFSYRGSPVPAVDLSELTFGRPSVERLSTRIIIVNCPDAQERNRLLGLIAEHVTFTLRRENTSLVSTGMRIRTAPYLGPVLMDEQGQIQLLYERHLLSEPARELLFSASAQVGI
jgi:chemotaxis-related protein WspB